MMLFLETLGHHWLVLSAGLTVYRSNYVPIYADNLC